MQRRKFFKLGAAGLLTTAAVPYAFAAQKKSINYIREAPEVIVIGAGIFGLWSAFYLQQMGAKVTLLDAYGAGNSRSSSGGESRIIRAEYGDQLMYSRWNNRAHEMLTRWEKEWGQKLIYSTGRLTLGDEKYRANALKAQKTLEPLGVKSEVLTHDELNYRWPQINLEGIEAGLFFPGGPGGSTVLARQTCHAVADAFVRGGGKLKIAKAMPGKRTSTGLEFIDTGNGETLKAEKYIFACGPWMAKVFPEIFEKKLQVFRRDVFFIGSRSGDDRYAYPKFPVWAFDSDYGMPDLLGQGLKIAPYPDFNSIDPDTDERIVNPYEAKRVRDFVNYRFPGLRDQPIVGTRVCQLTFSIDEHFIIDKHPALENVWFVGAGSGHGFKHGPALGEYVANRILKGAVDKEYDDAFKLKAGTF